MAGKNMAGSIRKMWKISDENRDDGEKTRQEPAQDRQKKMLQKPKNTGMTNKKTASSIRKTQKIPDERSE